MRRAARRLAGIAFGIAILALASRVAIPVGVVPITLQTLAVTVIGVLCGWRWGTITVVAWLLLAGCGLPLLAKGAGGLAPFTGPGAGFLLAFPFAAALSGGIAPPGARRSWRRVLVAMLAGNALCLTIGGGWLAARIGPGPACATGVLPFLPGAAIKSVVGTVIVRLYDRWRQGRLAASSSRNGCAVPSDGARQSPRGDSAPPADTLGPLGMAERLN